VPSFRFRADTRTSHTHIASTDEVFQSQKYPQVTLKTPVSKLSTKATGSTGPVIVAKSGFHSCEFTEWAAFENQVLVDEFFHPMQPLGINDLSDGAGSRFSE